MNAMAWLLLQGAIPQPTDDQVRRQLEDVFNRPEFSPRDEAFWVRWFLNGLRHFFEWLGGLYTSAPVLFWMLLAGCLTLLILLLTHITWTVRRVWFRSARSTQDEPSGTERQRLSLRFRDEAAMRASQADFTEAIRCLFLSLVYRFDESGRDDFPQSSTNREYLARFADRPPVQERLSVFVDTLDDYWYGQRPTERRQYLDCLALYEQLAAGDEG